MNTELPTPSNESGGGGEPHWQRLLHGIGAQLLGKAWVVVAQVLCVPILLSVWGPKGYGVWVMVSAIPTYATLSDFGFGSAGSVRMTQLVARGQKDEALRVFQSVGILVSVILAVMLLVSAAFLAALPSLARLFRMSPPEPEIGWSFFLLMVYSAFVVLSYVICTGFASTRRNARGTLLLDLPMPIETGVLLAAAIMTRSYVVCAASQLVVRAVAFILYYTQLRIDEPWLRLGWSKASWKIIRDLAKPSLANFALPFAQAMSLQGVVFAVGIGFGPGTAGVFSATRTFTRLPLQLVGVLTKASQPEITMAHALPNRPMVARLTALNLATTFLVFAPFVVASPWGGALMQLVTHGRASVQPIFYTSMEIVAALQAAWSTLAMFLFAESKLQKIVPWCLATGLAAVVAPLVLHDYLTLPGLAMVLGGLELIVLIAAARIWWRGSGLNPSDFAELFRRPLGLFSRTAAEDAAR